MKSYTELNALYGTLTKNTATANLTLGAQLTNDEYRHLLALKDFYFLHQTRTLSTVASQQFMALPYDVDQVESLYVTLGSMRYTPKIITSREQWDLLNQTTFTSDFARFAFVYDGQLGLWPTPATSANIVTINAKLRVINLSIADITSSTITTATNGSTSIVMSGGLTTQMAGFWIRGTFATAAGSGDGEWYQIASVQSATAATLVRAYGGTSIVAGTAASTIAQMPLLPEDFHDTPVYKAAATYWYKEGDINRADSFMKKYTDDRNILQAMKTSPVTDLVVDDGRDDRLELNPNLTIMIT